MSTQSATILPLRPTTQAERTTRTAPARAGVRLEATRRGRRLAVALAFLLGLLVAGIALLVLDVPAALAGADPQDRVTVTVEAGDTLWEYAEEYAPEGASPEAYIAEVRTLNSLPTGRLTAGQEIVLPVAGSAEAPLDR